mmetsp:Transcript_96864/g.246304  ORF Transcript_96864/g.246304 Transcript_96864/m.246304 type:complete len:91 (-) Transcript_96864:809-1081(-)
MCRNVKFGDGSVVRCSSSGLDDDSVRDARGAKAFMEQSTPQGWTKPTPRGPWAADRCDGAAASTGSETRGLSDRRGLGGIGRGAPGATPN